MARPVGIDRNKLLSLYASGWNDFQIGQRLGCNPSTVQYHRKKLGLKSNFKPSQRGQGKTKPPALVTMCDPPGTVRTPATKAMEDVVKNGLFTITIMGRGVQVIRSVEIERLVELLPEILK